MKKVKLEEQIKIAKGRNITDIEPNYGFPLFCNNKDIIGLGNDKKIIISEIWAFWDFVIKKKNFEKQKMLSLLEQAKFFYHSAENSPIKSQPLLYYYSFLNLAKIMLNIKYEWGFHSTPKYYHGAEYYIVDGERFSDSVITIHKNKEGEGINIADALFCLIQGKNLPQNENTINIKNLLANCIGVHRPYSKIYEDGKETFFKLLNYSLVKENDKLKFKAEVKYPSEVEQDKLQEFFGCKNSKKRNNFYRNLRNEKLKSIYKKLRELKVRYDDNLKFDNGKLYWNVEFSFAEKTFNYVRPNGYNLLTVPTIDFKRQVYFELAEKLKEQGIWYFIGDDGYTCYISSNPNYRYQPEFIIYNTMFYLGSITRYHPYLFDEIFNENEQWLISEFLTTQPKQFLYLATAKVLGYDIRKAYSSF